MQQKKNNSICADVEYLNDKGEFDFIQFGKAAGQTITKNNQEKIRIQLKGQQEIWDKQRQLIRNQKQEIKSRYLPEIDEKQIKIIQQLQDKQNKLSNLIKQSKDIGHIEKQNTLDCKIKQLPNPKKIEQKIDKMSKDETHISLFRFDQLETIYK